MGIFSDGINAAIYTTEGNYVQTGISGVCAAANLIPGGGAAVWGGKLAIKGGEALLKAESKLAAKETARLATKKAEQGVAELAAKKLEKEAAERAAKTAEKEGAHVKGSRKKGPCDHLKKVTHRGQAIIVVVRMAEQKKKESNPIMRPQTVRARCPRAKVQRYKWIQLTIDPHRVMAIKVQTGGATVRKSKLY